MFFNFSDLNWYSGMLIKPLHFNFIKEQNFFQMYNVFSTLSPVSWGVIKFVYNDSRVSEGIIIINYLHAILQDGSILYYNLQDINNYISDFTINLNTYNIEEDKEYYIYLCCKKISNNEIENQDRFFYEKNSNYISNKGISEEFYVKKIKPYFVLDNVFNDSYIGYSVIKFKKTQGIYVVLNYCPPYCIFNANNIIVTRILNTVVDLYSKLCKKYNSLSQNIYYQNIDSSVKIIDMHIFDLLFVRTQELYSLLQSQNIHVYDLYQKSYSLVISLCVSCLDISGINLVYNHYKMYETFENIIFILEKHSSRIFNTKTDIIKFTKDSDNEYYLVNFVNKNSIQDKKIYIQCVLNNGSNKQDMINMIKNITIVSDSFLSKVNQMRVLGIQRNIITNGYQLSSKFNILNLDSIFYIELDCNDEYFVEDEKIIIISNNNVYQNCNFNLVNIKE